MRTENQKKFIGAGLLVAGLGLAYWLTSYPGSSSKERLDEISQKKEAEPIQKAVPVSPPISQAPLSPVSPAPAGVPLSPKVSMAPSSLKVESPKPDSKLSPVVSASQPILPSAQGCYTVAFVHRKMASHADGEACLRHKNLLTLQGPQTLDFKKLNSQSICVRVNGEPVGFQKVPSRSDQLVIGALAGPDARVVASFCLGKAKCHESCVVKKDEFMSALGMDESSGSAPTGWDGSTARAKEDSELDAEVVAFNHERNGVGGDHDSSQQLGEKSGEKLELFSGWMVEKTSAACGS